MVAVYLQMVTVDEQQVGLCSSNMERKALRHCLDQLLQGDVTIGELVTDASSSVAKLLRRQALLRNHFISSSSIATKYLDTLFVRYLTQVQKVEESI